MMRDPRSTVQTASKDILARLLASEDLTVQHDAAAETAYFDTKNRVLCLPVWKDMDNSMYDMLVGHEVSHALHTPADGWQAFVGDDQYSPLRHMCLNVCEDVRIERKIKDKFPGLRRDFSKAYKSLHERDIFDMKDKNILDMPLIDRLNLYYKGEIYGQMTVPFTVEERKWLTRLDDANTFEEIVEIARDLFDATKEEQEEQKQTEVGEGVQMEGAGQGETESESDSGPADNDEQGAGVGSGGDEDDKGDSAEDDTDDGESADSRDGDETTDGDDLSYESYVNDTSPGSTQQNYEKARQDLRDDSAGTHHYYSVPSATLDKIIIDHQQISALWDQHWNTVSGDYANIRSNSTLALREFQTSAKPIINHMVQQFQQKQAASADKRSHVAKTGVLDTTSMINYRWSEDIFLKNEVHPDGKSHGIVIFLDWSGSMTCILKDTIEQLLILVEFCRKAGIPYDVYAFTSQPFMNTIGMDRSSDQYRSTYEDAMKKMEKQFADVSDKTLKPHAFHLLQFLTSKQSAKQHSMAVNNVYYIADNGGWRAPNALGLGSTPLNEAVVAALNIVPTFQKENGIQIVNTVFLTDGDGHNIIGSHWYRSQDADASKVFIQDPKTRKTYEIISRDTNSLMEMLKDRTGANIISIRLHASNNIKGLRYRYFDAKNNSDWAAAEQKFEKAIQSYKKEHFFTYVEPGCDLSLVVKGNLKLETDPLEALSENASNAKIRNAFIKGGNRKKSSRVISNKIVDIIAM